MLSVPYKYKLSENEPLEDWRMYVVYTNSARTSQITQTIFIIKVNQLILFSGIIHLLYESDTKHINTLSEEPV